MYVSSPILFSPYFVACCLGVILRFVIVVSLKLLTYWRYLVFEAWPSLLLVFNLIDGDFL